jgi:hypothetical protein
MEEDIFLDIISKSFEEYVQSGPRSCKKVDLLHQGIKSILEKTLPKSYQVEIEKNIDSINISGKKRCDIVLYKHKKVFAVFPLKFIMSNYYQNKNNSWEVLTGECIHLKWGNPNLHIIPINIIFNNVPYLTKDSDIKYFEEINYNSSFKILEILKEKQITSDLISYIIDVQHMSHINEKYNKSPILTHFNKDTPYRNLKDIISKLS